MYMHTYIIECRQYTYAHMYVTVKQFSVRTFLEVAICNPLNGIGGSNFISYVGRAFCSLWENVLFSVILCTMVSMYLLI
jgi:hypothetical protein